MADQKLVDLLKKNTTAWNYWINENPGVTPNLSRAVLTGAHLEGADLRGANLQGAFLNGAELSDAYLHKANLTRANLHGSYLIDANLSEANLRFADLTRTELSNTNLSGADLRGARLNNAILVETDLSRAILSSCHIYGIAAWNVNTNGTVQQNLVISPADEPRITVDDLEVAQFIYLMLNNKKIRNVIDEITSKAVLLLGRFSMPERKSILNSMREKLRELGFLPIVFDFEKPTDKDFTETIMTLAGLSIFIIADVTSPKSTPLELQAAVPDYQTPFVPIIQEEDPFSMLGNLQSKYDWVLDVFEYKDENELMDLFEVAVVNRALEKHYELQVKKASRTKVLTAKHFYN